MFYIGVCLSVPCTAVTGAYSCVSSVVFYDASTVVQCRSFSDAYTVSHIHIRAVHSHVSLSRRFARRGAPAIVLGEKSCLLWPRGRLVIRHGVQHGQETSGASDYQAQASLPHTLQHARWLFY